MVATWFALNGAHTLVYGISGRPPLAQELATLWLVGFLDPFFFYLLWLRRRPGAPGACMLLPGSTVAGVLEPASSSRPCSAIAPRAGQLSGCKRQWPLRQPRGITLVREARTASRQGRDHSFGQAGNGKFPTSTYPH